MPLNNPAAAAEVTSGNYTGNDTANRAIPHGLTKTPKLVLIVLDGGTMHYQIYGVDASINFYAAAGDGEQAVTIPDSTNFHVGNAANYFQSANAAATGFRWVAIG